jgi:hypothetical protein
MGKLINEPIAFRSGGQSLFGRSGSSQKDAVPTAFTWRGREYSIEALGGEWRELGRWWEGEGERRYIRAITSRGPAMDLCQDMKTGQWMVYEVQD